MKINLRTTSPRNKKRIQPKNVPSTVKAERNEKLKDIALKQKNQKSKTPQKEKKAPFVAKVTRMNRGAFLLHSTNEKNP